MEEKNIATQDYLTWVSKLIDSKTILETTPLGFIHTASPRNDKYQATAVRIKNLLLEGKIKGYTKPQEIVFPKIEVRKLIMPDRDFHYETETTELVEIENMPV